MCFEIDNLDEFEFENASRTKTHRTEDKINEKEKRNDRLY